MKPVIIYPPTIDWNYLHQRPQQLLKTLAEFDCLCIFCNINRENRYSKGFITLSPNLILANGQSFTTTVQWARTTFPNQPVVAYFTYPPHIAQIRASTVDLIIFDSVDEPVDFFSSWQPNYTESVKTADIVLATARSLVTRAQALTGNEIHLLPNGCDYDHFKNAQDRQYIKRMPFNGKKPIVGYIGAIAPWLDTELLNTMSYCLPEYEFVFIGPLLGRNWVSFPHTNMHYLGYREYCEVPKFLSNFAYCLIPFKITDMTKGVNPVKYWEYLASGVPILSTPLPEINREYVTIVTEDMFPGFSPIPSVREREDRITLARDNSWKERARKLFQILSCKLQNG